MNKLPSFLDLVSLLFHLLLLFVPKRTREFKSVFEKLYQAKKWVEFDFIFGIINNKIFDTLEHNDILYNINFVQITEINKECVKEIISPLNKITIQKEANLKAKLLFRPVSYVRARV